MIRESDFQIKMQAWTEVLLRHGVELVEENGETMFDFSNYDAESFKRDAVREYNEVEERIYWDRIDKVCNSRLN